MGVQGDGRTYSHCVGITLNNPKQSPKPWSRLYRLAKDIPRSVHLVNRCIFIFGEKIKGHKTEVTETYLRKPAINQLRKCDKIVNDSLTKNRLIHKLSQVPVVLFPNNFGKKGHRSVCIRTFMTNDFMTGVPAVVGKELPEDVFSLSLCLGA